MKLYLILILSLAASVVCRGTVIEAPEPGSDFATPETSGLVLGLLEFPAYSFYLGAPDVNGVAYVPNFSPRLGAQVRWKSLGLSLSFGLPLPPEEVERRGQSAQSSLVFSKHWRHSGVDIYRQAYRGFYVSSPITELDLHKPSRYPQLPDAEIKNEGINYYYAFESDKFSLSAAFNQMEFQFINGGSWIFSAFYNHLQMALGQKFIKGSDPDSLQSPPDLTDGRFDTVGAGGGYGYFWTNRKYFAAGQLVAALGIQQQQFHLNVGGDEKTLSPALKGNLNIAAGVNKEDWVYGGRLLVDSLTSNMRGLQVYSSLVNGYLFWGSRF